MPRAGVAPPRVAEADDQDSLAGGVIPAAKEADRGYSSSESPESPSPSAASPSSAGASSPSSPTSSASSSTSGSGSSSTRGGERVAIVTSSGSSATSFTPPGIVRAE